MDWAAEGSLKSVFPIVRGVWEGWFDIHSEEPLAAAGDRLDERDQVLEGL
jgi:hypothetical protein